MESLNFGHGFVPRVGSRNYKAVERALGPPDLFDVNQTEIPWVIVDGSWLRPELPLLQLLREHGTGLVVDTQGWRFRYPATLEVQKLAGLPHAPERPLGRGDRDGLAGFVEADLRWQEKLGANAFLLPTLPMESDEEVSLEIVELAAEVAMTTTGLSGRPLIASIVVKSRYLTQLVSVLRGLPDLVSGVYLQVTPVNPTKDSVSRLSRLAEVMLTPEAAGKRVIAGHLGGYGGVLRALGVSAADAGLGESETFDYTRLIRPRRKTKEGESTGGPVGARRYVWQLQRSASRRQWQTMMEIPSLRGFLDCREPCCRFRTLAARAEWAREHSLRARVTEARDLAALPGTMRPSRQRDVLLGARSSLSIVNQALIEAGHEPMPSEHVENQLKALERMAATSSAA